MELFEILFILFFILIPIINGISKSRQRRESEDIQLPGEARPRRPEPAHREAPGGPTRDPRGESRGGPGSEEDDAAELVPDDLWEILTGERRDRGPASGRPAPVPDPEPADVPIEESEAWDMEPAWEAEELPVGEERFEPAPWLEERSDDWAVLTQPESEPDLPRIALYAQESRASRKVRLAAQDALDAPRPRGVSPLIRELRRPGGVRQAVVLREILGPPKGLS